MEDVEDRAQLSESELGVIKTNYLPSVDKLFCL